MTREELQAYAENLVAGWPPLTPEQKDRLAILLKPANQEPKSKSA